jgi:hypothetical protein
MFPKKLVIPIFINFPMISDGYDEKMMGITRIKKKRIGKSLYQCWGIFLLKKTSDPNFDNVKLIWRCFNEGLNFILPSF